MNPAAKKILLMQVNQCAKKSKGRRFTEDEKLIALSVLKQSPKCYKFLRKIFILPSKTTLNKFVSDFNIESGINKQVFDAVKEKVNTLTMFPTIHFYFLFVKKVNDLYLSSRWKHGKKRRSSAQFYLMKLLWSQM